MTPHVASAPGKLFLFGEYSVLASGLSIVCAVGRRVRATVAVTPHGYRVQGAPLSSHVTLPQAVIASAGGQPQDVHRVHMDVSPLYDHQGHKYGLGSSAASSVALTAAFLGDATPQLCFDLAFQAHRTVQHGRGSGADVASSSFGGTLGYKLHLPQAPFLPLAPAPLLPPDMHTPHAALWELPLPSDLRIEAIWTGAPASSTALIGALERAWASGPGRIADALGALDTVAHDAALAIRDHDVDVLLECIVSADEALEALHRVCQGAMITQAHRGLRVWAKAWGLCTKISGAGGGDFSLICGRAQDAQRWQRALGGLPKGCVQVPMAFGVEGVRMET